VVKLCAELEPSSDPLEEFDMLSSDGEACVPP
jgi:hypothetical protein